MFLPGRYISYRPMFASMSMTMNVLLHLPGMEGNLTGDTETLSALCVWSRRTIRLLLRRFGTDG